MAKIFNKLHRVFQKSGYKLIPVDPKLPKFMDSDFINIYNSCKKNTMTDARTLYGLYKAVEYVVNSKLKGAFVECGVWKGGSAMAAALTFLKLGDSSRELFLYDTYRG